MPHPRPERHLASTPPDATHPLLQNKREHVITGQGLTLDEAVAWMIADEAELNGRALALAGRAA